MTRLSTRGRETAEAIRDRRPFTTGGALKGVAGDLSRWNTGRLPELDLPEDLMPWRADYVLISYSTPIAWHVPGSGWVQPNIRYSITTSGHQRQTYLCQILYTPTGGRRMRDGAGRVESSTGGGWGG